MCLCLERDLASKNKSDASPILLLVSPLELFPKPIGILIESGVAQTIRCPLVDVVVENGGFGNIVLFSNMN